MKRTSAVSSELLAPGGNLETALLALRAGADAVYVGLHQFSARQAATNLDFLELRRLKTATLATGQKLYVALNTIIPEGDWSAWQSVVWQALDCGVEALIVQDWGALSWLRRQFPDLPLHASTQMAVHNVWGARALVQWGVRRAVLARELTLKEIQRIHEAVPELELECFIHGSLCYGFSGLCLASGHLLGRSANRGECAQICRTWFETDHGRQFPLSTRDLKLGPLVNELRAHGVVSFKIEGRMKGPAYVENVVRYYRALLDHPASSTTPLVRQAEQAAQLAFSRPPTTGFFSTPKGVDLLAPEDPGHRGLPLGVVERVQSPYVSVTLEQDIEVRDGLGFLQKQTGIRQIRFQKKAVYQAKAGQTVELGLDELPRVGTALRLLKHGTAPHWSGPWPEPWAYPLQSQFAASPTRLDWTVRGWAGNLVLAGSTDIPLEPASGAQWRTALEAGLQPPKEIPWRLARIEWNLPDTWPGLFVPPSLWKAFKRNFWAEVAQKLQTLRQDSPIPLPSPIATVPLSGCLGSAFFDHHQTPGSVDPDWVELHPLQFDPESELAPWLAHWQRRQQPLVIVLNNVGHWPVVEKLRSNDHISFVVGYGFHTANRAALAWWRQHVPRLLAVCAWQEDTDAAVSAWADSGVILPSQQARAPEFLSRFCLRKQAWSGSCADCPGGYQSQMTQNGRRWQIQVRHCLTEIRCLDLSS